jgi:hypothetical protein
VAEKISSFIEPANAVDVYGALSRLEVKLVRGPEGEPRLGPDMKRSKHFFVVYGSGDIGLSVEGSRFFESAVLGALESSGQDVIAKEVEEIESEIEFEKRNEVIRRLLRPRTSVYCSKPLTDKQFTDIQTLDWSEAQAAFIDALSSCQSSDQQG